MLTHKNIENKFARFLLAYTKKWWLTGEQHHKLIFTRSKELIYEDILITYNFNRATLFGKSLLLLFSLYWEVMLPFIISFLLCVAIFIASVQGFFYILGVIVFVSEKISSNLFYKSITN